MHLETLLDIAEDGPWSGTHPPGRTRPVSGPDQSPAPRRIEIGFDWAPGHRRAGPEPTSWRSSRVALGLYTAIRLCRLGRQVTGPTARIFAAAAAGVFDEACGSVPLPVLIWLVKHHPPPPPPPWLDALVFTGEVLAFARQTGQEPLAAAAARQLGQALGTCNPKARQMHATE